MTITAVKEKLHQYIEQADEKKVQALYTLVADEIDNKNSVYDEATLNVLRERSANYISGKTKGYSVEESLKRIRKQIKGK